MGWGGGGVGGGLHTLTDVLNTDRKTQEFGFGPYVGIDAHLFVVVLRIEGGNCVRKQASKSRSFTPHRAAKQRIVLSKCFR